MFRLEPGCVLTRCGTFKRLDDGRLGMQVGDKSLALFGDIKIPENALGLYVRETCELTYRVGAESDSNPLRKPVGKIQVAVVDDLSQLRSSNGVFFTLPSDLQEACVTMTTNIGLKSGKIELSNVDPDEALKVLARLEKLSE